MNYRSALVTGASKGIGLAITRKLRALDLEVFGLARDGAALDRLAAELGIRPIVADLEKTDSMLEAVRDLDVDVLVNNAGLITAVKPLQEISPGDVARMIAVNLTAPLQLTQAVLPGMIARGRGHIFNLTTTASRYTLPGSAPYAAAKAGLSHAGTVLRYDLAGTGVRVTEISPGRVETDIYLESFGGDRDKLKSSLYQSHRAVQPEDVAEALAAALTLPERVDLSFIEVVPTDQAFGGFVFPARGKAG
ncbi:SDR family oxidoreductase [Rhodoligotrophos defluvii]|uniref:SDR family oxidoreductase n=1 Tax=Rhodoligotrophos defluvii TaxID=2561934 RepID=UPI0010C9F23E|nr:SDR family NAD(P)-dependent oxidoreductase [Rhodoligotrophos defluvii]